MSKCRVKLIPLILVFAVVMSLFAGCGGASKQNAPDNKAVEQGKDPAAANDPLAKYAPVENKKYKITWQAYQLAPIDENAELIKYWNEKFNVDIQVWNIEASKKKEILSLKLASREIPDKLEVDNRNDLNTFYAQDVLAEIPEAVFKKFAPNLYKGLETEAPGITKHGLIDGKMYGFPREVRFFNKYRDPVVWRGDWLSKLGISKAPETLAEFEDAVYKFANNDPDGNGKKDTYGLSQDGMNAIYGAHGYIPKYWADKGGNLVYGAVQPEMKNALKVLNKWYKDKVLDPEFITGENQGGYFALSHAFINGRIGYTGRGSWYHWKPALFEGDKIGESYIEVMKVNPKVAEALVFGLPPKGPDGKMGVTQGNLFTGIFSSFGKQLESEPDKMGKMLQMIDYWCASSEENYLTAYFGVQGKHWEYNKDKVAVAIGKYVDDKEKAKMGGHIVLTPTTLSKMAELRSPWASYAEKYNKTGGIRNKLETALPSASKYQTELTKIEDEAYISIITGDKPIDYFDDFVNRWNNAGGKQLTEEANKWYATVK